MKRSTFLNGAVTFVLLSLIIFVLIWDQDSGATTSTAQEKTANRSDTAAVQRFSLDEMIDNAGKIFRGTVLSVEPGTVSAGGTVLPTTVYRLRVTEKFKGTYMSKGDVEYAEITMLGNNKKSTPTGDQIKMSAGPSPPSLSIGGDYLLMITPESAVGLSVPVGLGQGSFEVYSKEGETFASNEFRNAGISNGPMKYEDLAARIRKGGK